MRNFSDFITIAAGIIIGIGIISKLSLYFDNNISEIFKKITKDSILKTIKSMLFMWNGLFALCVFFLILKEIYDRIPLDVIDCFIIGVVNSTKIVYINIRDVIGIFIAYCFVFILKYIVKRNPTTTIQKDKQTTDTDDLLFDDPELNELDKELEAKEKERPKIENKAKGLYREVKNKFDFEFEDFKYWIDEMIKEGVDLEYYDEGYEPNAELTPDGSDIFSLAETFIGCLIRRGAFDHTATLLDKGIKVDDREDWVKRLLMWFNFDMAELLIRGKAKLNPNDNQNYFHFRRFNFASETKPEYKKYVFFRLKAIAELMKIYGDSEGYEFLTEKIKEQDPTQ